jgi:hypothetical protein
MVATTDGEVSVRIIFAAEKQGASVGNYGVLFLFGDMVVGVVLEPEAKAGA